MKKLIILLFAVASCGMLQAQKDNTKGKGEKKVEVVTSDKTGWHKIGKMTASFKKEREVMVVSGADRFASIKIKAMDADIEITDLEVYYENDTKQDIEVRETIKAGTESRVIDLNGGERKLKKITFVYKTVPNSSNEKAELVVWGLKTNADKKDKK
jgi:hypothetical protein